jgi:tetratricopeptide (TPR) repeat protein
METSGPASWTMEETIAWSYDFLTPAEQALFRRLAVFAGGFTIEGAAAISRGRLPPVGGDDPEGQRGNGDDPPQDAFSTADALQTLIDESLLLQRSTPDAEPRFGMLVTIREFALELLAESGEAEETHRRHAAYCLHVALQAETAFWGRLPPVGGGGPQGRKGRLPLVGEDGPQGQRGQHSGDWRGRLMAEHENFRAALGWALVRSEIELALQLGCALEPLWWTMGHHTEGRRWLERALAAADDDAFPTLRVEALRLAAISAVAQSDCEHAFALAEEGRALALQHGDLPGVARTSFALGLAAIHEGDKERAREHLEDALARFRALNNRGGMGWSFIYLAGVAQLDFRTGHVDPDALEQAERDLTEALTLFQEMDHVPGIARAVFGLAYHACKQGDYARGVPLMHETIRLRLELGQYWSLPDCFGDLADVALATGRAEQAARLYGADGMQREIQGAPVGPAWREEYERRIDAVRHALNPADFATAWAAGRALTLDEAVAEALAV